MMKNNVSVTQILKIIHDYNGSTQSHSGRVVCEKEYRQFSQLQTPHGPVSAYVSMPLNNGRETKIYFNNPFALLHAAATVQPKFGSFLLKHLKSGAQLPQIVIYHDETTPGNTHRPDHGRAYDALLWTFAELPQFFRDRRHGYFKFAYVLSDDIEHMQGGIPALVKKMLLMFLSSQLTGTFKPLAWMPRRKVSHQRTCGPSLGFS